MTVTAGRASRKSAGPDSLRRAALAKPVLDMVPLAVAGFAGWAIVIPRVVLGTTGRDAALRT